MSGFTRPGLREAFKLNDEFKRVRVKPEIATLRKTQNFDFKW